ncbi:trace amine-associated receptor 13c-like [Anabas testudineus]|uniref:trace amine-associated receptor 13c-like n=1 Tax=Anabas testudineus TaxID=64144 RepID=UPI000E45A84A|nr:trace amine-associated receptor 13c-like [Anabas testudineus]
MKSEAEAELCFPELNISCRKPALRSRMVLLNILVSSVSVSTVALNLLVIITVSHFRQLHTPTNILLLSLAVSDFLVGLVLIPGEFFRRTSCWFLGDSMCSLYKYFVLGLGCMGLASSLGDMILISAERYVAICDPLHYSTRVTVPRVRLCVFLCWVCSVFYFSVMLKWGLIESDPENSCYGECVVVVRYVAGVVDLVFSFIAPITVITVLYMRVFVVAVSQARAMNSHVKTVIVQRSITVVVKKSELKAARTLGVLLLVFLLCFCPYYCVSIAGDAAFGSPASYVVYLFYFNSCLNPVIYTLFYPWFRKAIKLIVTCKILQPGSSDTNILQRGSVD